MTLLRVIIAIVFMTTVGVAVAQTTDGVEINSTFLQPEVDNETTDAGQTLSAAGSTTTIETTTHANVSDNFSHCCVHDGKESIKVCFLLNKTRDESHCVASENLLEINENCHFSHVTNSTVECEPALEICDIVKLSAHCGTKCHLDDICNPTYQPSENVTVCTYVCKKRGSLFERLLPLWIVLMVVCAVILAALCLCTYCCCRKKSNENDKKKRLEVEASAESVGADNPALEYTQISELSTPPTGDIKSEDDVHKVELSAEDLEVLEKGIVPFEGESFHLNLVTQETRM